MKFVFILVLIAGAAVAGAIYGPQLVKQYTASRNGHDPKEEAEKALMQTAPVKRGDISLTVAATGRVVSNLDVDIKCKASGIVIELPRDVSDPVKKGDLLVKLDPIDEQRNVDKTKVDLTSAEAKLAMSKENLKLAEQALVTDKERAQANIRSMEAMAKYAKQKAARLKAVLEGGAGSQEDADAAETNATQMAVDLENAKIKIDELKTQEQALEVKRQDVKLAEANVDSTKISLEIAQQRLSETTIRAPIDGVVAARNIQVGTIISSGISNVGGGTTVMVISDLESILVYAAVDESEIGKVEVGQDVNITADAHPGMKFRGKVVRIATRGVNVSNVITFEVRIEVTSKNKHKLKPEMTTNVEVVAAERKDALTVPMDSLSRKQGKRIATVQKPEGGTEERTVETGINDGTNIEIVSGLSENETVTYKKGETESRWKPEQGRTRGPTMFGGRR